MGKKKLTITIIFTLFLIGVTYGTHQSLFCATYANQPMEKKNLPVTIRERSFDEKLALEFLQNKLQTPNGLIFYAIENKKKELFSVSESLGQAMEYAALTNDVEMLNYYAQITDKYFRDPRQGYYYWRIDITPEGEITKAATSSALVDDLRLLRSYFIAREHNLGDFSDAIKTIAVNVAKFDFENGYPCDYYDGKYRQKAKEVSLFYLDVETLKSLSEFDNKWTVPYQNMRNILLNIPEQKYGFYPYLFKTDTKKYVYKSSTNMVENLYTALFAFHAGKDTLPLLNFLRAEMKKGYIFNHYYNATGKQVNTDESASVYALATRFFALHGDMESAKLSYKRMMDFMIEKKSSSYGGFGDENTGMVYAFDHLEALIMMRMVWFEHE